MVDWCTLLLLQVVGGKIAQLEARKRLAVEREDYDLAKALKADIEKLRVAGESAAMGGSPQSECSCCCAECYEWRYLVVDW